MFTDFVAMALQRLAGRPGKVVLPEGVAPPIVAAAVRASQLGVARPVLLGVPAEVAVVAEQHGLSLTEVAVLDPAGGALLAELTSEFRAANPAFPEGAARRLLADPLAFAAMMVRSRRADAMVAGLQHSTAEVLLVAQMVIGLQPDVETPSSMFVMDVPGYAGGEAGLLAFADCAVVPDPTAEQLADIAITTAHTVRHLLGWEPRVAMLSFSTKGSGQDQSVDRVAAAVGIVHAREPGLLVDGELQADAALVPEVAALKLGQSPVAGHANVLVFPDLDAGNIGYKLVQRLAGAGAYGPLLQGFTGTVSDLSRGASVDDVVAAIALSSLSVRELV